jgi:hypothetical protein
VQCILRLPVILGQRNDSTRNRMLHGAFRKTASTSGNWRQRILRWVGVSTT